MSSVVYREASAEDVNALAELSRETFCETFAHLYDPADLALFIEDTYTPSAIARDMADPNLLYRLAEEEDQLVGYCKVGYGVTLDYDPGDKKIVELKQLYVRSTHQGAGVAQALTDWALAEAAAVDADAMLLSVYSDNPRGQRFYQKNGFRWIADTYFMVGNHRDDEFLYLKDLK